jgi:hypothetical protein
VASACICEATTATPTSMRTSTASNLRAKPDASRPRDIDCTKWVNWQRVGERTACPLRDSSGWRWCHQSVPMACRRLLPVAGSSSCWPWLWSDARCKSGTLPAIARMRHAALPHRVPIESRKVTVLAHLVVCVSPGTSPECPCSCPLFCCRLSSAFAASVAATVEGEIDDARRAKPTFVTRSMRRRGPTKDACSRRRSGGSAGPT